MFEFQILIENFDAVVAIVTDENVVAMGVGGNVIRVLELRIPTPPFSNLVNQTEV